MRKALLTAAAVILASLSSAPAWAWGCSGHEVIALIAHQELQTLDQHIVPRFCLKSSSCLRCRIATTRIATAAT